MPTNFQHRRDQSPGPHFQAIFEALPSLCLLIEPPDYRLVAVSDTYLQATMTSRADIIGRLLFEVFPDNPDDPTATGERNLRASLERVMRLKRPDTMAIQQYDIRKPEHEGGAFEQRFWSPLNAPVLVKGEVRYIIHRVEDVTEFMRLKQSEQEVQREYAALQLIQEKQAIEIYLRAHELMEANSRLQDANEELSQREAERQAHAALQETNRRKDEFLAMLAHELRNPLAPVLQAIRLLRLTPNNPEMATEMRDMVERQVLHMAHLIDDLLDLSRITRDKIQLRRETLALDAVVAQAIEAIRPLCDVQTHRLHVDVAPGVFLQGDPTRLEQILGNLLSNACKYSDAGSDIWVTATTGDGEICLSVRDNGIGIAADLLPDIFEMFAQGTRSLDRSQGGLGIGLTLVRRLAEMHGGRVEAISEGMGQGSEFRVYLPALAQSQAKQAQPAAAPQPVQGARETVLVVDDNADMANTTAKLLSFYGYDVKTAYDGTSGLALAETLHPRIVLLDIGLPGLTGYEVAAKLRETPGFEDILLVAITGYGREEDRRDARAAGFDHHLIKPIDFELLLGLLGRRQGGAQARPN